jgi:hypothetical protein
LCPRPAPLASISARKSFVTALFPLAIPNNSDGSEQPGEVFRPDTATIDFFMISLNMRHTFCICFVSLE